MGRQRPPTNLMAVLEARGYRATAPRKAVAELLQQKQKGFTVEALVDELPSVGKATIYRTIKLFLKEGLVCKFPMMDGASFYSLASISHRHHHSVCVQCGEVGEFEAARIKKLLNDVGAEIPGRIVDHRIELYINCEFCPMEWAK